VKREATAKKRTRTTATTIRATARSSKTAHAQRRKRSSKTKPRHSVVVEDAAIAAAIALALHDEALVAERAAQLASSPTGWTALARQRGVRTR
jgi:hypothetical protein